MFITGLFISFRNYNKVRCLQRLYHDNVRVRFAPSPTGLLHLGGLRTALYNYLFAKAHRGHFILRIEDTDQSRTIPGAIQQIEDSLKWMGISIDEGPSNEGAFGPYIQSDRVKIYQDYVERLLKNGSAYHCFCSQERLQLLRKEALKRNENPGYDNRCRHLSENDLQRKLTDNLPHVIRFKLDKEPVTFEDLVYGPVTLTIDEGDPVIMKQDRFPTYHLANVVDDHLMKITHVLRGTEWQVSTPKHILMYRAFGFKPPTFAHLPHIANKDGTKLSKRQGDIHVQYFQERGYHPEAVLNFIMRVGGGTGRLEDRIYPLDEFVDLFSLDKLKTHSAKLEMERLDQTNRRLICNLLETPEKKILIDRVRQLIQNAFGKRLSKSSLQAKILQDSNIEKLLNWSKNRIYVINDLVKPEFEYLWIIPDEIDFSDFGTESATTIEKVHVHLETFDSFSANQVGPGLKNFSKEQNIAFPQLMKLLRASLSNLKKGPGVAEMMEIFGKEETLLRLQHAHNLLSSRAMN